MDDSANERFTTRVPKKLLDQIEMRAAEDGMSRSAFARKLMETAIAGGVESGSAVDSAMSRLIDAYAAQVDAETKAIEAKARILDARARCESAKADRADMENILFRAAGQQKLISDRCSQPKILVQADPFDVITAYPLSDEKVIARSTADTSEQEAPSENEAEPVVLENEISHVPEQETDASDKTPIPRSKTGQPGADQQQDTETAQGEESEQEESDDRGDIIAQADDGDILPDNETSDPSTYIGISNARELAQSTSTMALLRAESEQSPSENTNSYSNFAGYIPANSTLNNNSSAADAESQTNEPADETAHQTSSSDTDGGQDKTAEGFESGHVMSTSEPENVLDADINVQDSDLEVDEGATVSDTEDDSQ